MIQRRGLLIAFLVVLVNIVGTTLGEEFYKNVTRLRWAGPPGSEPGIYEDFIQQRNLFSIPPLEIRQVYRSPERVKGDRILIVVEENLHPLIEQALMGYVNDLESEGYTVTVVLDTAFGGTPMEFRNYLRSVYNSEGLSGALLVGDLPIGWHESTWDDGGHEEYPCDYFFMDLDGQWSDTDQDGIYDEHSGDRLPEIWTGRMVASPLSGNEADFINDLFSKSASYRQGTLTLPPRGLTFIDDDWSYWTTCGMDSIYLSQVKVVNDHQSTVADTYQIELGEGYESIQVCAHSWPGGHHFSSRPCDCAAYAHAYIESDSHQECELRIGGRDGFKVWLNGEEILADANGTDGVDDDHIGVTLNEGVNSLLVKVVQDKYKYGFAAHFTDQWGEPLPGLTCHLENPSDPDRYAPYITAWLTNGFHHWDYFWGALDNDFLGGESAIYAYEGLVSGGKTWLLWDIGSGFLDFSTIYDDLDMGAVYAFTHIYSDSAQILTLWLGTYSGAKVWLNGDVVYYDNAYHEFEPDSQEVELDLQEGWNRLLIKISVWYGAELSGRIGDSEKREVEGFNYDPASSYSDYIHGWLMNGFYKNHDPGTRLTQDYLNGESTVLPSEGDSTGSFCWVPGYSHEDWFDLESYFSEDGGWVESSDIETIDPDGLLYNLFACSAARYTESDYIAGRYTFADTYGLTTIGSTKSGSMLYFEDFYAEMGRGRVVGEALKEWFRKRGEDGLENWEVCWYYGLTLIGDPTVCFSSDFVPPAAIADLSASRLWKNFVLLSWTAPGDNGDIGTAKLYDLRYSQTPVETDTLAWWDTATTVIGEPAPSPSGMRDSCVVSNLSPETTYYFLIRSADERLNWSGFSNVATVTTVGVGEDPQSTGLPHCYSLSQNYPNPFNATTVIRYKLWADGGRPSAVTLKIYNILGQEVAILVDGEQTAGDKSVTWDASSFSSGIYFYRLKVGDFVESRRMVVLK